MALGINFYQGQITHEPIKLGLPFLFRHIDLLRHTYVGSFMNVRMSSSSVVMAQDLKSRPKTHGRDDDSARAVVNRTSFVESFTLQLSRKGTLAFISKTFPINMSDL